MRKPLIVANWKMHKTIADSLAFLGAFLASGEAGGEYVDVVLAPPFTALYALATAVEGTLIELAAQTMHWAPQGAFTGEISPLMLSDIGVRYTILGHSERRAMYGEMDEDINLKVKSALAHGITPIVAVGETAAEHHSGLAHERVAAQTRAAFDDIAPGDIAQCVVAYEPIWAIGTGHADSPASASAVMGTIRNCVAGLANARILYGGSVKPENIASLIAQPNIDGGLVGGASLTVDSFVPLVRHARRILA